MIPGHGGIMDRFDCQFLMATFVNVYISSFIRTASPAKLLAQVSHIHCADMCSVSKHFFLRFFFLVSSIHCDKFIHFLRLIDT